ncbi:phosphoserine aminotransferase [Ixodes scapularis]|uniref:phosphoserine aminotransferase n=1 Tax=Ixodes scapularis TaxID=6945 RepID=UPI001C389FB7|nr:phosphoserine aminotransferase [Ixodes scapularis]
MAGNRKLNFSAGPSALPLEVLEIAQKEMLDYHGCGASVMELSHRSPEFAGIVETAEADLRELMGIPSNYKVIFLQGGGTGQFSAVPLNLCPKLKEQKADYVVTGTWSAKAAKEAEAFIQVNKVLPKVDKHTCIPPQSEWKLSSDASYLYYCDNETIHGVEFNFVPDSGSVPLVCDMSSNILTKPVDVSKYGLIFAGAQKNLGMAGVTVVIVREDLVGQPAGCCPSVLSYKINAENKSLYNTPPTYAIYILGLVMKWVKRNGGVEGMARRSAEKSRLIYNLFDMSNNFYVCNVNPANRSRVNIPFRIGGAEGDDELEKLFLKEATKRGMIQLKGHRSVGGIRVSVFNAMSVEAIAPFLQFAKEFEGEHRK